MMLISLMESTVPQTVAITINENTSELMAPVANARDIHDPQVTVGVVWNLSAVISSRLLGKAGALFVKPTLDPPQAAGAAFVQHAQIREK